MALSKYVTPVWLVALLLFPFVLWALPAGLFDGEGGVILCPSRLFFGIECISCGMTRAIMHFHHFDFEEAFYYNQFVPIAYLALVLIWFIWTRNAWRTVKSRRATDRMAPQA